jgi:hypothetical protein
LYHVIQIKRKRWNILLHTENIGNEKIIQSGDDGVSEEWSDGEDKAPGFDMNKPDLFSIKAWKN